MKKLILGPPGTGKTTYLIQTLETELKTTDIKRIAYISFTKAAIEEARNRSTEKFKFLRLKDFVHFKTLHAICYRLLGCSRGNVIDYQHKTLFQKVMEQRGIKIDLQFKEDDIDIKNIHLYLYHIAINRMLKIEDVMYLNREGVDAKEIDFVIQAYADFKTKYHIIDYNDMLKMVLDDPAILPYTDIDTVFLDEAQDLTPLQWEVFNKLFNRAKRIYIAGDDDQSIYTWAGVDVEKILHLDYDEKKVLDLSYRLPSNVLQFSKSIINQIDNRYEKEYTSRKPDGEIKNILSLHEVIPEIKRTIRDKKWLVLIRNTFLSEHLKEIFYEHGIPFNCLDQKSIVKKEIKLINAYEAWRKTDKLSDDDESLLKEYKIKLRKDRTWYESFYFMPLERANYYRDILKNKLSAAFCDNVEITTIHRSKGREADNVIVCLDMAALTYNEYIDNDRDSEHRTFYVAVTRTKENLYILEPETNQYYEMEALG